MSDFGTSDLGSRTVGAPIASGLPIADRKNTAIEFRGRGAWTSRSGQNGFMGRGRPAPNYQANQNWPATSRVPSPSLVEVMPRPRRGTEDCHRARHGPRARVHSTARARSARLRQKGREIIDVSPSRENTELPSRFNVICPVQSLREKYSAHPVGQIIFINPPHPNPAGGADRESSRTRDGMRWTRMC
jgi:hypothetical protein